MMSTLTWIKQRLTGFSGLARAERDKEHTNGREPTSLRKRGLRIVRREILLDHFFLDVIEAEFMHLLPDGRWSDVLHRVNIDRGDSVAALAYEPVRDLVHLTRQFRFPTYSYENEYDVGNGWFTEIPAGRMREGEAPEECIKRELSEELGAEVNHLAAISNFYLTPGASSEKLFLFYAEVSLSDDERTKVGGENDDEYIEKISVSSSEFFYRLDHGKIPDAKTIIAGNWLRRHILSG